MTPKIYAAAERSIREIWQYTYHAWGEQQADQYFNGLIDCIEQIPNDRTSWRNVAFEGFAGVWFVEYRYHNVYFRELTDGRLGVISVLNKIRNLPARLREDDDNMGATAQ